ncbi:MAG: DEAD/DEAH box helicase [Desulfovibrio sp.]
MDKNRSREEGDANKPEAPQLPPAITIDELPDSLSTALENMGWDNLTPAQAKSLPLTLDGRDIKVQARTGSGKTGAFLLPMLANLDAKSKDCQALILAPTRELAVQVARDGEKLFKDSGLAITACYGGAKIGPQLKAIEDGAQVVVGTPGRVLDILMRQKLKLDTLRMLVFDEADRMLSIGFYPDMKEIQRYLPHRRQTCMFSATYPPYVLKLSEEFLYKPAFLGLSTDNVHVAEVEHIFCEVPGMGKERNLIKLIELENPASAIIFCNTRSNVHFVTAVLQQFGYDADELTSDLSQNKREKVLARIRGRQLRFLVATDVAARGIDIPELSHVFLYEPPEDHESYIHRAGRTGRAGAAGVVISLVDVMQKLELGRIATQYSIPMTERPLPSDDDVQEAVGQRVTTLLSTRFRGKKPIEKERMRRFATLAKQLAEDEEMHTILAMLLDETYQASLNAPAPIPAVQEPKGTKGKRRPQPQNRNNRNRPRHGKSGQNKSGHPDNRRQNNRNSSRPNNKRT